jgi:hypothetical protein
MYPINLVVFEITVPGTGIIIARTFNLAEAISHVLQNLQCKSILVVSLMEHTKVK